MPNVGINNSSTPSAAYMRQWSRSTLVQVMACRLFGAKPLPEPMLVHCQLDSWEQLLVKIESEFYNLHSTKCIWKCRLLKWWPFCPGGDGFSWRGGRRWPVAAWRKWLSFQMFTQTTKMFMLPLSNETALMWTLHGLFEESELVHELTSDVSHLAINCLNVYFCS